MESSFAIELISQVGKAVLSSLFVAAAVFSFIAWQRGERLRVPIDHILRSWARFRKGQADYLAHDLERDITACFSELRNEFNKTDKNIIRPNFRTRQEWLSVEERVRVFVLEANGDSSQVLGLMWSMMINDPSDPLRAKFERMLKDLADFRDSLGLSSFVEMN